MIIKELDKFDSNDKFTEAGRAAEEQMAFYLRRAFQDTKDIKIFNDLRLEKDSDAAQIDHLALHRYGIIIIESKSVMTRVEVNNYGEWKRWTGTAWQGMASPILQAKRQAEFLEKYLEANAASLLGKVLGMQSHFGGMSTHWLVAISDSGIINRPPDVSLPEVHKADQVIEQIRAIVEQRKKASGLFNLNFRDAGFAFSEAEFTRITEFLSKAHKPRLIPNNVGVGSPEQVCDGENASNQGGKPSVPKPIPKPKPVKRSTMPTHICPSCQSNNLIIDYGYSYYFKCLQCKKNNRIEISCDICKGRKKVRKSGPQFFVDCGTCGTSELFHLNSERKQGSQD